MPTYPVTERVLSWERETGQTCHRLNQLPKPLRDEIVEGISVIDRGCCQALGYLGLRSFFLFAETIYGSGRSLLDVPYHLDMAQFFQDPATRKVLVSFRGGYKTTIGVAYLAWRMALDPNSTHLVVSYKYERAVERISELKQVLENSQLVNRLYPWLQPGPGDAWSSERLTVKRDINVKESTVQGTGIEGGTAGMHVSTILTDDIVNEQNFQSPDALRSVRLFVANSESLLVNPTDQIVHIGNRWGFDDVYGDLLDDPAWLAFPHGSVWADGEKTKTFMPKKYTPRQLARIESAQTKAHGRAFYLAQYEGEIVSDDTAAFSQTALTPRDTSQQPHLRYCLVDPAISSDRRADDTAILEIHVTADGHWTVAAGIARQGMRPEDIIEAVYNMQLMEDEPFQLLGIETGGYQKALVFGFQDVADTKGFISIQELKSGGKSKELRIKSISPKWNVGGIHFSPQLDQLVLAKLRQQSEQFPYGKHDDVLDCLSMFSQVYQATPESPRDSGEQDLVAMGTQDSEGHIMKLRDGVPGQGGGFFGHRSS